MTGHTNFDKLRGRMTKEQRATADRKYELLRGEMLLAELRKLSGLTQQELADILGVTQPSVSEREKQEDMEIGTLAKMIEANKKKSAASYVSNINESSSSLSMFGGFF